MWQNFVCDVIDKIYDVITFNLKYICFKKAGVAIFADIIKILTMFIITIYKDSRKVKINRNYISKYNLYLDIAKLVDSGWKNADVSRTQGVCHVIHIFFHHCRICVTDFREERPFCSPYPWAAPKKPILNRIKTL